jgi:CheY-like chemotaxis protein
VSQNPAQLLSELSRAKVDPVMVKGNILVVEDESNLLAGIRDILELEDYAVEIAADGLIALDALESRGDDKLPDVIISDATMPRLDGLQLSENVRNRTEWDAIAFIIMSGEANRVNYEQARHLGVDAFLPKPFDPEEMLIEIVNVMRGP